MDVKTMIVALFAVCCVLGIFVEGDSRRCARVDLAQVYPGKCAEVVSSRTTSQWPETCLELGGDLAVFRCLLSARETTDPSFWRALAAQKVADESEAGIRAAAIRQKQCEQAGTCTKRFTQQLFSTDDSSHYCDRGHYLYGRGPCEEWGEHKDMYVGDLGGGLSVRAGRDRRGQWFGPALSGKVKIPR